MIRALLFDFDGLLVDTERNSFATWADVWREHGLELALDEWVACVGTIGGFDTIGELERRVGSMIDRDAVVAKRRAKLMELNDREELRPGVSAYLDDAQRLGLATAVVSSSSTTWVQHHFGRLGRAQGWSCIVCAEGDATRAKPRPTLYLEALERLGVEPDEAIAFEDSPNGVAAAKAAGIYCVAVPNSVTEKLDLSGADVVVGSLEELPLRELLTRVASGAKR